MHVICYQYNVICNVDIIGSKDINDMLLRCRLVCNNNDDQEHNFDFSIARNNCCTPNVEYINSALLSDPISVRVLNIIIIIINPRSHFFRPTTNKKQQKTKNIVEHAVSQSPTGQIEMTASSQQNCSRGCESVITKINLQVHAASTTARYMMMTNQYAQQRKSRKICSVIVLTIGMLVIVYFTKNNHDNHSNPFLSVHNDIIFGRTLSQGGIDTYVKSSRRVKKNKNEPNKPIIFTFYNEIDEKYKHTGMTDRADQDLLKLWKKKWTEAGWDPRILDMNDAKDHRRFKEFDKKLQQVPLHGPNTVYNQYCYYRWLAMAAVGGGWMSDYDVLPLNFHYPDDLYQDGRFTIYSAVGDEGGGIPCLMSGSESEWERLAFSIVELGGTHDSNEYLWSDMMSSIDLYKKDHDAYELFDVMGALLEIEWDEETCNQYNHHLAIHFSHSAMRKLGMNDFNLRPQFAAYWMNEWKTKCRDFESIDLD